jgi:hypothetical protein
MEQEHPMQDMPNHEPIQWRVKTTVDKYEGDWTPEQIESGEAASALFETVEQEGNLLVIGGASALWQRLIGTAVTAFDNTNAYIGVGDSTTAAADTQTDLVAATNKLRKAMDATYPQHTDSTGTAGSKTITYRSTFATTDANYAWQEWAIFNASTGGRMLNRKVESLGTKTSAATWQLTVQITLA